MLHLSELQANPMAKSMEGPPNMVRSCYLPGTLSWMNPRTATSPLSSETHAHGLDLTHLIEPSELPYLSPPCIACGDCIVWVILLDKQLASIFRLYRIARSSTTRGMFASTQKFHVVLALH